VIHLDTSFLIRALVRDSPQDRRLRDWVRNGEGFGISSVAWAEFLCGPVAPLQMKLVARVLNEHVPFGEPEAALAAALFNEAGRRRGSLSDCMIAATAIRAEAALATQNPKDFQRFAGAGLRLA
jgi:predicted nucleic acid-binding protein